MRIRHYVKGKIVDFCNAGRPAPGKELTGDFNVLEAGLQEAVSLDKGNNHVSLTICFLGICMKPC